ncbi:hypothetical protein [Cylindrospermopsis raciborskii]|uniref:hypothetical protein n=1 Tax=Cylindrospermopsis raciborskii TaxID=77022 RepID=UPI002ED880FE
MKPNTRNLFLQIIVPTYKGERSLFREGGEHQILVAIAMDFRCNYQRWEKSCRRWKE